MKIKFLREDVVFNNVPYADISIKGSQLKISLDDKDENRITLCLYPIQAIKLITEDCYDFPAEIINECKQKYGFYKRHVVEILDSPWIQQLKTTASMYQNDAGFLDKSRHFLIDLRDNIVEVVAWNIEIQTIENGHSK